MIRESGYDIVDINKSGSDYNHTIQGDIELDHLINQVLGESLDDGSLPNGDFDEDDKIGEICYQYDLLGFVYPEEVTAEEVEGISKDEEKEYEAMMTETERSQGQTAVGTSVRFAISSMESMWTVKDIVDLSGASRNRVGEVVEQEEIRGNCELIAKAKTGGRPKRIYITHE